MSEKTYDVAALGELLIDFTQNGLSEQGNPLFEANPGGAPCNVLAMLRKLGKHCAFLGKVGQDGFGRQLAQVVREAGIDLRGLRYDEEVHTTLAIVQTLPGGDRDFSFYRRPGADANLAPADLDEALLRDCRIFHFGSLSLTGEPCRAATQKAVALAKEGGAIISFDPNLRPPLWDSLDEAKAQIAWGLGQADVVKIADNEMLFMTGRPRRGRPASAVPQHPPAERHRRRGGQPRLLRRPAGLCAGLRPRRRHRDHRRRRHLLRLRAALRAKARPRRPDRRRPRRHAALRQRGGVPRHHQEGRHQGHAHAGAGGEYSERK